MSFSRACGWVVTVGALAALPAAGHAAPPLFQLAELPAPKPGIPPSSIIYSLIGMNESGEVLGTYSDSRKTWVVNRTVVWRRDGTVVEVPKLPSYDLCSAAAIDDAGRVVGTCSTNISGADPATDTVHSAYVFDPVLGVRPLATPYREGQPEGFVPRVVNARGQVAGTVGFPDPSATGGRRVAVLSPGKGVRPLPADAVSRFPTGLNDHAELIAASEKNNFGREGRFVSPLTGVSLIPSPGGTTYRTNVGPFALNNKGVVVGTSQVESMWSSWMWDAQNGTRDLGSLHPGEEAFRCAVDINDAGEVIGQDGQDAYYYAPAHGMLKLHDLLDPSDPLTSRVTLLTAFCDVRDRAFAFINDAGQIAVHAIVDGQDEKLFKLVPIHSHRPVKP